MIKNCTQCGCEFDSKSSRKIFCSKICKNKDYGLKLYNITKNCIICSTEFKSRSDKKEAHHCSRECMAESKRNKNKKECAMCGVSFRCLPSKEAIYCSRKCSSMAAIKKKELICGACGIVYEISAYKNTKYCSPECYFTSMTPEFKEQKRIEEISESLNSNIDHVINNEITWDTDNIEDIFGLSTINIDEQLNAKTYVGSLKRRY